MGKVVRDFVYVDVARLQSLYSQVFEGVAEQIVQQTFDHATRRRTNIGNQPLPMELETQIAEASLRTESSILHDHMYNRLEESLSAAIFSPQGITPDTFADELREAFLIKIEGNAEIEDYNRIQHFAANLNDIGQSIAYCATAFNPTLKTIREDLPSMIKSLEEQIRANSKNYEEKRQLQTQLRELKQINPDEIDQALAKEANLYIDPKFLTYISSWFDMFYPHGFEITIVPPSQPQIVYRGVLDKQFLRLTPEYLRNLYGGYVNANWVMVGQVTYLPGTKIPEMESVTLGGEEVTATVETQAASSSEIEGDSKDIEQAIQHLIQAQETSSETSSMRDPIRQIFKVAAGLEKMFFESKVRIEVLVRPLAIYQETIIPDIKAEN